MIINGVSVETTNGLSTISVSNEDSIKKAREVSDFFLNLVKEKSYSLPFSDKDLLDAYNLGRQEVIDELITKIIGYPVGGVIQGMVHENVLKEYKKRVDRK